MTPGKKYRIICKPIPGVWRKPREMVFTFVAEEEHKYIFSARPEAGTQDVPKHIVEFLQEVDDLTPILLPVIYRGETKVS